MPFGQFCEWWRRDLRACPADLGPLAFPPNRFVRLTVSTIKNIEPHLYARYKDCIQSFKFLPADKKPKNFGARRSHDWTLLGTTAMQNETALSIMVTMKTLTTCIALFLALVSSVAGEEVRNLRKHQSPFLFQKTRARGDDLRWTSAHTHFIVSPPFPKFLIRHNDTSVAWIFRTIHQRTNAKLVKTRTVTTFTAHVIRRCIFLPAMEGLSFVITASTEETSFMTTRIPITTLTLVVSCVIQTGEFLWSRFIPSLARSPHVPLLEKLSDVLYCLHLVTAAG